MKVIVIVLVALISIALANPAKGSTKASLKAKPCIQQCTDDYKPVCAGDGSGKHDISFGNECVFKNYNCENEKDLKLVQVGECPGGGGVRLS